MRWILGFSRPVGLVLILQQPDHVDDDVVDTVVQDVAFEIPARFHTCISPSVVSVLAPPHDGVGTGQ